MQHILGLVDDHDNLSRLARNLGEMAGSTPPCPEMAFDALVAFRLALNTHLAAEEEFLKGADQAGRREFAAFSADHEGGFADLVEEWSIYLAEWSEENIREDWSSFAKATRWMMGRLCEQIRMENDFLYPLALKHGLIALRPQAA